MVAGAVAGNISPDATSPSGNIFAEAMRGVRANCLFRGKHCLAAIKAGRERHISRANRPKAHHSAQRSRQTGDGKARYAPACAKALHEQASEGTSVPQP